MGMPGQAMVAGDVRANENIALTATHTLFAREHNRIVDQLPRLLPEEQRFQIARRVVGAEQQFITYNEFLPALGVRLSDYRGYNPNVNATLGNEFAVVGYRAHSMIHGELEPSAPAGTYTAAQLDAFERDGDRGRGGGRRGRARHPAQPRVRQPRPARGRRARPGAQGHRRRAAVQERRHDRQPAPERPVPGAGDREPGVPRRPDAAGVLHGRRRPRRDRRRARPRPRHAALQRPAPGVRPAGEVVVRRRSRASRPRASRTIR